jgi:hypothetical protein
MKILNTSICDDQNNQVYPQVESMGLDYDWDAKNSIRRIVSNVPLEVVPDFKSFHLDPETKITDIVSQSYIYTRGLLVSERFWKVLQSFVLQAHETYLAQVVHRDTVLPYRWIHMTEEIEERIDYAKSDFRQVADSQLSAIDVKNWENLRSICAKAVNSLDGEIIARKIMFLSGVPKCDLLFVQLTSRNIFVSDQMASRIRAEKFTGFKIEDSPTVVEFS